jgi:hypothetical protein
MITISIALNKITKAKMLFGSLYTGLIIIASIRMFHYNKEFSNNDLYAQDTRRFLDALNTIPLDFDKNTSIWLTDESFMWPFLLKDFTNVSSHDCNFNNQKILFVSEDDKNLPRGILENYRIKSQASWFTVYELK